MQILVVDDDPLAGEMAVAILEDAGHQCQCVENGLEALERLAEAPDIDLIISDMNMPLLSGLELFQELRNQGLETPFVLLTGDDPQPLIRSEPRLTGCLMKDASLEEALYRLVSQL